MSVYPKNQLKFGPGFLPNVNPENRSSGLITSESQPITFNSPINNMPPPPRDFGGPPMINYNQQEASQTNYNMPMPMPTPMSMPSYNQQEKPPTSFNALPSYNQQETPAKSFKTAPTSQIVHNEAPAIVKAVVPASIIKSVPVNKTSNTILILIAIFIILWAIAGIAAFIMSCVCYFYNGTQTQKLLGAMLAVFLGPFYWIYFLASKTYCTK